MKGEEMRKKIIALVLTASIALCCMPVLAADDAQTEYTFRDIPWYSTKTDVEQIFEDDGMTIGTNSWENQVRRMSAIDFLNTMSGSDYVDGGGYVGRYTGVTVAGYEVSEMGASYIYTIDDSGNINKSDDDALFYFGWYEFDANDYVDGDGVYNDLAEKLVSIYGEGVVDEESKYHTTITWCDESGNQIRLLLGGKDWDTGHYVTLGYIAAGADERLDEIQGALDAEKAAEEAAERESNKDDLSGL